MKQQEALELLKLGQNIFLTGAAGSGKTFLLNQYVAHLRSHEVDVAITASTGIAATHIGGQTIHSWCGIGIRDRLSEDDLEKILADRRIRRNLEMTKVLIVDEISMLHAAQLDLVELITRRALDSFYPFGGLQVVLCGDFFQLPPVVQGGGEKKFAYEAHAWQNGDFQVCYLEEQYRQGNDALLTILNDIRGGRAGEHTKVPLRTRYKQDPVPVAQKGVRPTILYARNINVDSINNAALLELRGEARSFHMTSRGFEKVVEALKRNCLAPEELHLKIGAEVLFVKNAPDGSFVNGTRGVVEGFKKGEGWPLIRTLDGALITASPEEWRFQEGDIVRASIFQVPLRLAWAITIHKSQGMTLDAVEVDLSDAFEPGMGYVALSRVRRLDGLKLMGLNDTALQVNPKILAQDQIFRTLSMAARDDLQNVPQEDRCKAHDQVLFERFRGVRGRAKKKQARKGKVSKQKTTSYEVTREMVEQRMALETIASEREVSTGTILNHLEKLKGLGRLPNIEYMRNTIPPTDFENILSAFRKSGDGKLTPLFDKFEGLYTFETLRTVRLFV